MYQMLKCKDMLFCDFKVWVPCINANVFILFEVKVPALKAQYSLQYLVQCNSVVIKPQPVSQARLEMICDILTPPSITILWTTIVRPTLIILLVT